MLVDGLASTALRRASELTVGRRPVCALSLRFVQGGQKHGHRFFQTFY